jgi:NAD-dependent dihydropyrimidine dehydrogenase PreA subunit
MNVSEGCIGCGSCVPCCPMEAISLGPDKAEINQDECVECNACIRAEVCPTDSLIKPDLKWPRTIRRAFSDPGPQHATGVPGRGTEEMKTNDVTGRYCKDHAGFVLDIGRPGIGTRLRTVEKIYKMLIGLGVHFEEQNPLRSLLKENDKTSFKEEVLNEKVLSIIIEFIVPSSRMKEILEALKSCAGEIDTVFSVGLVDRVLEDGSMENAKRAEELGYRPSVNAKVNVGLGRPLADS